MPNPETNQQTSITNNELQIGNINQILILYDESYDQVEHSIVF